MRIFPPQLLTKFVKLLCVRLAYERSRVSQQIRLCGGNVKLTGELDVQGECRVLRSRWTFGAPDLIHEVLGEDEVSIRKAGLFLGYIKLLSTLISGVIVAREVLGTTCANQLWINSNFQSFRKALSRGEFNRKKEA